MINRLGALVVCTADTSSLRFVQLIQQVYYKQNFLMDFSISYVIFFSTFDLI